MGETLMQAILRGEKPCNFLMAKQVNPMGDGVRSPIDDKVYTSRHSYESHLKQHGCEIVGNDFGSSRAKRQERELTKQETKL
jgi:hypothetical protein